MSKATAWISSFRLRTLPLALSSIGMGSFLALQYRLFQWDIFILNALTAILLQILSNLANDYGDSIHGGDNEDRVGPKRGLQNGEISLPQMKIAIAISAMLALISGCWLLHIATKGLNISIFLTFLIIGLLCIAAAIKYTAGKNPYGYVGLGDISVFLFFGIVGVACTFFLYTHAFRLDILLPAITLGLLSTGVLNINNMRDINSDTAAGKRTMVVRMGLASAKTYHTLIILLAIASMCLYTSFHYVSICQWLFLISAPLLLMQVMGIRKDQPEQMDKYLKQLSLTTLLLVVSFGIGIILQNYV